MGTCTGFQVEGRETLRSKWNSKRSVELKIIQCGLSLDYKGMEEGEGELNKSQIIQHLTSQGNVLGPYSQIGTLNLGSVALWGVMDEFWGIACENLSINRFAKGPNRPLSLRTKISLDVCPS